MAKACLNLNLLDDDELSVAKFNLEDSRKKKQIPASESVELLKKLGVDGGEIKNISGQSTIDMVKQYYDGYKTVVNSNFDSPSLREITKDMKENIPRFGWKKIYAPVYYVLSKGGKSSKKLADKLLDYDVVYTKDKAFADDTIIQIQSVLGKDINNMEILEPEMRNQKGRPLTVEQRKAVEAFDLINKDTNKLWSMNDKGFNKLDEFTQKHIVGRSYHKQMTDFYWKRVKAEVKSKSTKFQYEEWLKEYDEKYIKNYMTRAVSREVLQELAKNGADSNIISNIANKRLKSRAKELASEKFNKKDNPNKWEAEHDKNLKDPDLLEKIREEAYNIMTYNPARVVNKHFKKRGILLDYETEVTNMFGKKKMVRTYVDDYASVMDRYSTVTSKFISTTKFFPEFTNFGTKFKITGGGQASLEKIMSDGGPQGRWAANHINELLGLGINNQSNSITNFLSVTSTLSAAAGLSSPTSGVKNLLITIPRSLGTFGSINTTRAFVRLFNNYGKLMDDARREGFTTYQTKTLALQDKAVKLPFNLGEFSMEKLFDFNLMTYTEGVGRVAQVQAGLMTFELQLDKVHGVKNYLPTTPKNQIKRFWKNTFKLADDEIDFLLDKNNYRRIKDGLSDVDMTGKMDYIRAKISHYSHVSTSGGTGPQLLPSWMNNRYIKPMSLFYRMAYSTTFDMAQNTIKPAVKYGNIAPLARASVGSLISGWALWAMYDTLFDTKNPTENEDAMTQISSYLWRAEFLQLGTDLTLNPYGGSLFSKKDRFSFLNYNDQMMASSFNPIYGSAVIGNIISAGSLFMHTFVPALGATEKRKTVGQALDSYMSETVVLYAQYRKNMQKPFGLGFKNDKLYKTSKEFGTYGRKWKAENGYQDNPMAYGQTDRTPFYNDLRDAFYNGNQKDFNRAYWAAYNYIATTFVKEFRNDGQGLSPHQIHRQAQRALDAHLNQYSVTKLAEGYDEKRGIIPEREFLKYLKNNKLRARYKKAKDEFFYRKRKLVTSATATDNYRKYSAIFTLK